MSQLRKIGQLLKMLPKALSIAMPGLGPWLARRRWPQTRGTLVVPGLQAPVEVLRDRWGVPHLYAQSEPDLFFAQGYVHAQDRLWQIEIGRRTGDGRLSEALGPATVPADRLLRTLGLRHAAEQCWSRIAPDSRLILEAYAAGVNARIQHEPLPVEFALLDVAPTPFTPIDVLVRGNLLCLLLGGNHRLELLRAQITAEAGPALADLLLPSHAPDSPMIVPPEARLDPGLRGVTAMEGLDQVDRLLGDPNIVSGSNNWVVHGRRTQSGKPLLCNDVHIGLGIPSVWYENSLHGGRFAGVGFSLPGIPLLILGHNGKIAWGMSNLGPDTQDFYLEQLDDPKAPAQYRFMDAWHPIEVRREQIPVRGAAPVPLEIRSTRHGPLMNQAMSRLLAEAQPMALRWTLHDSAPLIDAVVHLNLASTWQEFRAAIERWEIPGQNFVYADTQGNIAYQASGRIPIRPPGHTGVVPMPGWTGEHEWQGYIPFEELPASFNPPAGFAATANNRVTDDSYPHLIAANWFPGYRARRITDLLQTEEPHTVASMQRIQGETYSLPAQALRPHLLAISPADDLQKRALADVAAWDLHYETDRRGAAIFQSWYICLLRNLLAKKLGPTLVERYLASEYERHGSMHMPLVIRLLDHPEPPWFTAEAPDPPATAQRDALVQQSLADALRMLSERFGPDPAAWTWGRVHTVTLTHTPFGHAGPGFVRRTFNSQTLAARGDNYTVDGASFLWSKPFSVVHGTAMRMIIDLGDLSQSVGVHMPGQSEHLYHPHREDLMALSQRVEYHPLLWTREAVEAHAEDKLSLVPPG